MSGLLTAESVMMCPHGGTVTAISSNTRVTAGGAPILRSSDTFLIAGCTFSLPTGLHPCVSVQWLVSDLRSQVLRDFTLSESSVGLCIAADQTPQGTVLITSTQPQVSGQ